MGTQLYSVNLSSLDVDYVNMVSSSHEQQKGRTLLSSVSDINDSIISEIINAASLTKAEVLEFDDISSKRWIPATWYNSVLFVPIHSTTRTSSFLSKLDNLMMSLSKRGRALGACVIVYYDK